MRKQELIHLHGLLGEITRYCSEEGMSFELADYHEIGTRPTSIQHPKAAHKDAVLALATATARSLDPESKPVELASAD